MASVDMNTNRILQMEAMRCGGSLTNIVHGDGNSNTENLTKKMLFPRTKIGQSMKEMMAVAAVHIARAVLVTALGRGGRHRPRSR